MLDRVSTIIPLCSGFEALSRYKQNNNVQGRPDSVSKEAVCFLGKIGGEVEKSTKIPKLGGSGK